MKTRGMLALALAATMQFPAVAADLAITKTVDNPSPATADTVQYEVRVENVGADAVSSVTVTDALPSILLYLSHSNGTYAASNGVWNVGALPAGASSSLTIRARVLLPPGLSCSVPSPEAATNNYFGCSVARVGTDTFVVGAYGAGAGRAYLMSANGTLLMTYTNPTPVSGDQFGFSVAGLGTDKVIVGAPRDDTGASDSGCVYVFGTNGTLLATIASPAPQASAQFGYAVAALGDDKVIVGANQFNPGSGSTYMYCGRAYLFNASGTLLATLAHPSPGLGVYFGAAVAGLGADKVAVGAYSQKVGASPYASGSVYVFGTNGTLLTTIPDPTPALTSNDWFGYALAALDADTLAVGAPYDSTVVSTAGSIYLYSAGGTLRQTISNPRPVANSMFGSSVAAWDADKIVGTAPQATVRGITLAGAAYVVDTNGTLLANLDCPTPVWNEQCGSAVAYLGAGRVAMGSRQDETGAPDSGMVFLFEPAAGGEVIRNTAILAACSPADTNPLNNTGTVTAATGLRTDLAAVMAGAHAALLPGATNAYTVTLTNRGPVAATAILADEVLPDDLWFLSATPSAGTYDTATNEWSVSSLAAGEGASLTVQARVLESWPLSLYVTNPAGYGGGNDMFGDDMAPLGSDKVIIGSPQGETNRGCVYLFTTNGDLLTKLISPTPTQSSYFGQSVAAVGTDKVLVGAWQYVNRGAAYLFDTNGVCLQTIASASPETSDWFGWSVAGLDGGRFIVGSSRDRVGSYRAGSVFVYSTNGTLLATASCPDPLDNAHFGGAVAALGTDRMIVGCDGGTAGGVLSAGCAYLYDTNGTLLTTFTNPAPTLSGNFGYSVDALGTDRVVIGMPGYYMYGVMRAGTVHIFDTNGVLQATIPDPMLVPGGGFGITVDAVGTDRIIVGCNSRRAYVFDAQGGLVGVIREPAQIGGTMYRSVCGLNSGRAMVNGYIGSYWGVRFFDLRPTPYYTTNRMAVACAQAVTNEPNTSAFASLLVGAGGPTACDLTLATPYGSTVPAAGVYSVAQGTQVTAFAASPDSRGTTQYVCTGWTATANLSPASGSGTQAVVTVNGDGTVTWTWRTEYWLNPGAATHGAVDQAGGWFTNGASVAVGALPERYYHFTNWTGDVTGGAERDNPLTVVMDRPRAIVANFAMSWTTNKPTPYWWLGQFGITNRVEESVLEDVDQDGVPSGDEYVMNTVPTNPASYLHIENIEQLLGTNDEVAIVHALTWPCATDRVYDVQYGIDLSNDVWSTIPSLTNLAPLTTSMTVTNTAAPETSKFYRVRVRIP